MYTKSEIFISFGVVIRIKFSRKELGVFCEVSALIGMEYRLMKEVSIIRTEARSEIKERMRDYGKFLIITMKAQTQK